MPSLNRPCAFLALAALAGLALLAPLSAADKPADEPTRPAFRLSEPFTHDNLTVFLVLGDDALKGRKFLTLDEALKQKKVVVHETKSVNELSIENVSGEEVFIQAGDIVKGGQQDRTLGHDLVVPPRSGKMQLASFCVEQGRWSPRGKENVAAFDSAGYQLADNRLKLACRLKKSQSDVWDKVARVQDELGKNLKEDVKGRESASSLQLTLEHKKVREAIDTFVKKLQGFPADRKGVVGYVAVVNGKVSHAEIYGNAELFSQLWPKLLQAVAIEAVTAQKPDAKIEPVKTEAVWAFLTAAEKGKRTERTVGKDLKETQREDEKRALLETSEKDGGVLRRSYFAK